MVSHAIFYMSHVRDRGNEEIFSLFITELRIHPVSNTSNII